MLSQSIQEEAKLTAMQRVWQARRGLSSSALYEEVDETEELFSLPRQNSRNSSISKGPCVSSVPPTFTCSDIDSDNEKENIEFQQEQVQQRILSKTKERQSIKLDASTLGDLPATYTICALKSHQFPVAGVYVDKRVLPGFKYRVRPLPAIGKPSNTYPCLFNERALTLQSIGRGYSRRFTFEADENKLNHNENYFWSDNRPEGFAFELEVISDGDKFTLYDLNHEAQGTLEVLNVEGPQIEIGSSKVRDGIEKRVNVKFAGKVEFYETGVAKPMPLSGVAVCVKHRSRHNAEIIEVRNVTIKRRRYTLKPGIHRSARRVTVRGKDINDIPTKYTMTGLEPYEQPVVGTYVDPRIIPGFYYKVRPNDRKEHFFQGRSLKLCSIGMGYAKRLTFAPDSLVAPDNYLWSDNHPDGLGLEPRAVHTGMRFSIVAKDQDQKLGEACVFRTDVPQMEEKMEKVMTPSGKYAIVKYIHIDVMCHVKLAITGGGSADNEEHLMRVYGLAIVRKEPNSSEAKIVRVDNVALDSQLNLLFANTHTELTFHPINY